MSKDGGQVRSPSSARSRICDRAILPTLLASVVALVFPAPGYATFPGGVGRIAYGTVTSNDIGNPTTIDADGTNRFLLDSHGAAPSWSADGARLAFIGRPPGCTGSCEADGIVITNAYGGDVHQVPIAESFRGHVAWSPDGQKLAFDTYQCGGFSCFFSIYTTNIDGTETTFLTSGEDPVWSPNGDEILFTESGEIFKMNVAATTAVRLTTNSADDITPDWSSDGSKIAFASNRDGNYEIYVMNSDGSGQTRITNQVASDTDPAWSPDGSQIAFESQPNPNTCGTSCDANIYVMNNDGTAISLVTPFSTGDENPDWEPVKGYARPKSATPTNIRLVPYFFQCNAPNATHGAPLDAPSCSPATPGSDFLTVGAPDSNLRPAQSTGSLTMKVRSCPMCASPLPPDVLFNAEITDVRNRSDLSDYTGQLLTILNLRITDRSNGPNHDRPGTVVDAPLSFSLGCSATAAEIGATCTANTSANAVMPGLVVDFKRAIWQIRSVEVDDGGPDADISTPDNSPFATQGLFAP